MQRKKKTSKAIINGVNLKIGIVVSKYNSDVAGRMLKGAMDVLVENKVKKSNIKVVEVPGSFEIPLACLRLAKTKKYNALIALGAVVQGETDHHIWIAEGITKGIMDVILKYEIPIGFGVLTAHNLKQVQARSQGKNNKGREAAEAALKMVEKT